MPYIAILAALLAPLLAIDNLQFTPRVAAASTVLAYDDNVGRDWGDDDDDDDDQDRYGNNDDGSDDSDDDSAHGPDDDGDSDADDEPSVRA